MRIRVDSAQESQPRGFVYFERKSDIPAYALSTDQQPLIGKGKHKKKHRDKLKNALWEAAQEENVRMIEGDDIDIEIIYATRAEPNDYPDIDNATRAIVNALQGIAYKSDKQVRMFTGIFMDLNREKDFRISSNWVEIVKRFVTDLTSEHRVVICIYSDSQLEKLDGAEKVERERAERCSQIVDERIPPERRV